MSPVIYMDSLFYSSFPGDGPELIENTNTNKNTTTTTDTDLLVFIMSWKLFGRCFGKDSFVFGSSCQLQITTLNRFFGKKVITSNNHDGIISKSELMFFFNKIKRRNIKG